MATESLRQIKIDPQFAHSKSPLRESTLNHPPKQETSMKSLSNLKQGFPLCKTQHKQTRQTKTQSVLTKSTFCSSRTSGNMVTMVTIAVAGNPTLSRLPSCLIQPLSCIIILFSYEHALHHYFVHSKGKRKRHQNFTVGALGKHINTYI